METLVTIATTVVVLFAAAANFRRSGVKRRNKVEAAAKQAVERRLSDG